ncbi:hypothetical protein HK098_000811 [Nowakowskiella sp. JEL0407]|nr:hypothetical protein HK098_000811 [Nowakowskiella sp. JEL0407]
MALFKKAAATPSHRDPAHCHSDKLFGVRLTLLVDTPAEKKALEKSRFDALLSPIKIKLFGDVKHDNDRLDIDDDVAKNTVDDDLVPNIVKDFIKLLSDESVLQTEGIFRLATSTKSLKDMRDKIESTGCLNAEMISTSSNIVTLSCVFKTFLREIPDGLIQWQQTEKMIQASGEKIYVNI